MSQFKNYLDLVRDSDFNYNEGMINSLRFDRNAAENGFKELLKQISSTSRDNVSIDAANKLLDQVFEERRALSAAELKALKDYIGYTGLESSEQEKANQVISALKIDSSYATGTALKASYVASPVGAFFEPNISCICSFIPPDFLTSLIKRFAVV